MQPGTHSWWASMPARNPIWHSTGHVSLAGTDDRIVVVHAWEVPLVTGYDMVVTIDPGEIEQLSLQGLTELVGRIDDDRLEPVTHQGHAGRGLVTAADEHDAAAIVVGHRGDSRVSMMLGSTANYVLHHTDATGRHRAWRPQRSFPSSVVVGVDDSDLDDESGAENESTRAVRWAYAAARRRRGSCRACLVPPGAGGRYVRHRCGRDSTRWTPPPKRSSIGCSTSAGAAPDHLSVIGEAVRGTPGFALIEASRDVDLVVVGSRGRGGFKGLLLGSTSAEVASHSHAPVVVIR